MKVNSFFGGPIEVKNEAQKAQVTKLMNRTELAGEIAFYVLACTLSLAGVVMMGCVGLLNSEHGARALVPSGFLITMFGLCYLVNGDSFKLARTKACADALKAYKNEKAGTSGIPLDDIVVRPLPTPEHSDTEEYVIV